MAVGRRRGRFSATAAATAAAVPSPGDGVKSSVGAEGSFLAAVAATTTTSTAAAAQRATACVRLRPRLPHELEQLEAAAETTTAAAEAKASHRPAAGVYHSEKSRAGEPSGEPPSSGQRTAEDGGGPTFARKSSSSNIVQTARVGDCDVDDEDQPLTPSTVATFVDDEDDDHRRAPSSPGRRGCVDSFMHPQHQLELSDDVQGNRVADRDEGADDVRASGGRTGDRRKPSLLKRVVGKARKVKAMRRASYHGNDGGGERIGANARVGNNAGTADDLAHREAKDKGQSSVPLLPTSSWEIKSDGQTVRCPVPSHCLSLNTSTASEESYSFDAAYGVSALSTQLYSEQIRPVVRSVVDGIDGLVLLHGPSGGGRTHCLIGTEADPGIVPLAVLDLFAGFREKADRHAKNGGGGGADGEAAPVSAAIEETDENQEERHVPHRSSVLGWRSKGKRRPRQQSPKKGKERPQNAPQSMPTRREKHTYSLRVSLLEITPSSGVHDRLCPPAQRLDTVNHIPGTGLTLPERVGSASLAAVRRGPNEIECGTAEEAFGALARGRARLGGNGNGNGGGADGACAGHVVVRMIATCRIESLASPNEGGGGDAEEGKVTAVSTRTAALTLVDPLPSDSADADDGLAALESAMHSAAGSDLWNAAGADNDAASTVHSTTPSSTTTDHKLARMLRPLLAGGNANLVMVCALPPPPPPDAAVRSSSPTASLELDASLKALRLAEQFRSIPVHPRANDAVAEDTPEVRRYKEEIAGLRAQLAEVAEANKRKERVVDASASGGGGSGGLSSEDARKEEARKRRAAEEELSRSRAEVERLRRELAGAGTVRIGSGRRVFVNARHPPSGPPFHRSAAAGVGDDCQDIFRGDSDDARREQKLRDVEKHVDNAIKRIVAAHGIRLPAALRQGWASGRSGGAWDSERGSPSKRLVGVNESEEEMIIREDSHEGEDFSGNRSGGARSENSRLERDCASSQGTNMDAISASNWKAMGAIGHLLDEDGGSASVFTDPKAANRSLMPNEDHCCPEPDETRAVASISESPISKYLPSNQLRSLSSSGSVHHLSTSFRGSEESYSSRRPLSSPAESVRESVDADALSAAGGSLTARLLGEGAGGEEENGTGNDEGLWEEEGAHDSGTFATALQGSFTALKSGCPPPAPKGLDADGRVSSPDTFITALSPGAARGHDCHDGRSSHGLDITPRRAGAGLRPDLSPGPSPVRSFHSDFDRVFSDVLSSHGVGGAQDSKNVHNEGHHPEQDIWRGLNAEEEEEDTERRHHLEEDEDDDVLSVVSDAVSSLTSATTLFGHRDVDRHRNPAVVVAELWRIQTLLRTALQNGGSSNRLGFSGDKDFDGRQGSASSSTGGEREEGNVSGHSPYRGSAFDKWV